MDLSPLRRLIWLHVRTQTASEAGEYLAAECCDGGTIVDCTVRWRRSRKQRILLSRVTTQARKIFFVRGVVALRVGGREPIEQGRWVDFSVGFLPLFLWTFRVRAREERVPIGGPVGFLVFDR